MMLYKRPNNLCSYAMSSAGRQFHSMVVVTDIGILVTCVVHTIQMETDSMGG